MTHPNTAPGERSTAVKALVDARSTPWTRRLIGAALILLVIAVGAWLLLGLDDDEDAARYKTAPVTRGELVVRVSATGNLQPTNQVEVGSELSGIVERVLVDENDRVKRGQVLARLDVSKLRDTVTRSRANLAAAEAQVLQARATVAEARATRARYQQVAELSGGKVPSKSEMDTAEANLKRAEANEASARAAVVQARATLQSDETNLAKASIRSPIDGVVLARKVEPGQTVAASFQAPVLFTLAEDLARMELQVDVDEADVGQVEIGQKATFTVDAWPGRLYDAVITRVGYGSQVKEGVVSYLTVLEVDNDDLSLRPGMTGTAEITTLRRADVLLVPNAALRFTPPQAGPAEEGQSRGVTGLLMPRLPRQTPKQKETPAGSTQRVWVLRDGRPAEIAVKVGATDGRVTEVTGGDLKPGMEVITEAESAAR
ncbi:Secretion protein HlyD [Thiobacillus denitrificans ATCC 25259]|uniref:Secretion protein HlyD n=1 Tax=Thiobacillus denitrificans (strain ATCC 25259 / T1) TaxID=292415 RepID=Q3SJ03_THIDA|nr:efflux RND transporter periplasmic adaptor subunit [Thiobacillus denitrificans]AAZ97367.1 Secretion protein HlyD [Thiobacillus denitrificans ATCC 25259]